MNPQSLEKLIHTKFVHVGFQKKVVFYSNISLLKIQVKIPIYVWNTDKYRNTSLSRLKCILIDIYICNTTIFFEKLLHCVSHLFRKTLWWRLSSDVHTRHQSTFDDCPIEMQNRASRFLGKYCIVTY